MVNFFEYLYTYVSSVGEKQIYNIFNDARDVVQFDPKSDAAQDLIRWFDGGKKPRVWLMVWICCIDEKWLLRRDLFSWNMSVDLGVD